MNSHVDLKALDAEAQRVASTPKAQISRAEDLANKGMILEALEAIQRAQRLDARVEIRAVVWNAICWNGSLEGMAERVLRDCENAVTLASENELGGARNSRGLARALLGNLAGAAEDFRYFADWAEARRNRPPNVIEMRREWATALQVGKNPITDETLKQLKSPRRVLSRRLLSPDL